MKIAVIGIGPGHPDLITPQACRALAGCQVVCGGKRQLAVFDLKSKETVLIDKNMDRVIDYLKQNKNQKKIAVLASGDPCFYGITKVLKQYFSPHELEIVPGISSFQYLAARCCLNWEKARLCSLHGREEHFIDQIKSNALTFFLTDARKNPQYIARCLVESGLGQLELILGHRLSYPEEAIIRGQAETIAGLKEDYAFSVLAVTHV